ncbi:nucleoside-diphosphate sugar epimerase/dehydratase [Alkalibacterium sp. 20]|uniref:polysaccharide biosynthesis protein n=1 Tax=Alkalibacterium sp. 20 TaxID=1798803 RepID=UPI000923E56C|nr:nucleoside-diphosphate sugar epimerase/dehydratase [Alkalibacterium sp. 20]OJF90275.1 short-chain dehydrogenase [Alkalibacterium sp. 20]
MSRNKRIMFVVLLDVGILMFAAFLSLFFLSPYVSFSVGHIVSTLGVTSLMYLLFAYGLQIFTKMNHFTTIMEVITLSYCIFLSFSLSTFISLITVRETSLRYFVLHFIFSSIGIIASRVFIRIYFEYDYKKRNTTKSEEAVRTLLVGAGNGGSLFIRNLKNYSNKLNLVGIVDDDVNKQGFLVCGVKVIGTIADIPSLVNDHNVDQVTIAIPSLSPSRVEDIVDACNKGNVAFNQMPYIEDFLLGKMPNISNRDINVADLLGREEVTLDTQTIFENTKGKTILVSGAGGSIGSEIVRQLSRFSPERIVLLGHGENSIYHIHKEMRGEKHSLIHYVPVIADVQDKLRMEEVMRVYKPQFVFHAAAHKHVPLMEYNPHEALKNNVYGTKNIAEASKKYNVDTFIMISSDKAVNPTNVMGASKRIAEMIVTGLNEPDKTVFSAVRFGNVLGSRGSVVPLFQEQIKNGGPVTITDFRMTRYFMTIPEASRLVIQAGMCAEGGEVFVLDMGDPVKILDLAKKIVKLSGYSEKEIPLIETGIRSGEKLYEELLIKNELTERKVFDKIFVGRSKPEPLLSIYRNLARWEMLTAEELRDEWLEYTNEQPIVKTISQKRDVRASVSMVQESTANI